MQKEEYEGEKYERQMGSYTGKVSDRMDKRSLGMSIRTLLTDNLLIPKGLKEYETTLSYTQKLMTLIDNSIMYEEGKYE